MIRAKTYHNYRDFLRAVLLDKIKRNPRYSLRSFARDLSVAPSSLSNVLSGRKAISRARAYLIADHLKLSRSETDYFCGMVELESSKGDVQRESLLRKLQRKNPTRTDLSLDLFKVIADWHHSALIEYIELTGKKFTVAAAARAFGLSQIVVREALERLLRLNLVCRSAEGHRFVKAQDWVASSPLPNEALQHFMRQVLAKASESFSTCSASDRVAGTETVAFARKDLEKVRAAAEAFFDEVKSLSTKTRQRDSVFVFLVQGFPLTTSSHPIQEKQK